MKDQSEIAELIRFARIAAVSTGIDVYPGDGDWTAASPTSSVRLSGMAPLN